ARIINDRHFDRLAALLEQGRVVIGGRHDRDDLYIEPTVIEGATPDRDLMTGEIFGPILPVMTWQNEAEIYAHLTPRDKPLALYVFSKDRGFQYRMVEKTSAGMMAINEMLLFAVVPELPFGGGGASGMGSYSGTQGFCTFSHFKPVLRRGGFMDLAARYAPYDAKKERLMRMAQG
ncbi:MAG: aldehyde dehydrogenase family protein, partial [Paracoccus sp. (in: a-proteobacteria)]